MLHIDLDREVKNLSTFLLGVNKKENERYSQLSQDVQYMLSIVCICSLSHTLIIHYLINSTKILLCKSYLSCIFTNVYLIPVQRLVCKHSPYQWPPRPLIQKWASNQSESIHVISLGWDFKDSDAYCLPPSHGG